MATEVDLRLKQIFESDEFARQWYECTKHVLATIGGTQFNGGVNSGDQRALFSLVHHCRPLKVLEIGTRFGASTIYIACALKQLWGQKGRLTTVDIQDVNDRTSRMHRGSSPAKTPLENMAMLDCLDIVEFVTAPSHEFLTTTADRFDFIFIDGSHKAETVYVDIVGAVRRINSGGFIVMHDYYPGGPLSPDTAALPGPYLAVERVLEECPSLQVLPFGTLPWSTRPGSRMTSLAALVAAASALKAEQHSMASAEAAAGEPGIVPV